VEQSIHFICITYQEKHYNNGMDDVWGSYGKNKFVHIKNFTGKEKNNIALTFEQRDSKTFHLYNLPWEALYF